MAKGIMYIDGQRVPFDGEKNVLAVIRKAGIDMPTFCYYSELSTFGACRMCVVEDEKGKIDTSCSMEPRDGMKIRTNTTGTAPPARKAASAACRTWRCSSACGMSAFRTPGRPMRRTALLRPSSGTPTSASSAATACGCATRCRAWRF